VNKEEIIRHWLQTGEILPPAKGNETYLGFPVISEAEGQALAKATGTAFIMGEFVPPADRRFA
jgi:hypothetical protein